MPARDSRYEAVTELEGGQQTFRKTGGHRSQLVPDVAADPNEDLEGLSKEELQGRLKHMGLPVSGTKEELSERLRSGVVESDSDAK